MLQKPDVPGFPNNGHVKHSTQKNGDILTTMLCHVPIVSQYWVDAFSQVVLYSFSFKAHSDLKSRHAILYVCVAAIIITDSNLLKVE